ncbi:atherin-like [Phasianus colchicus]|uniref:atherin-like n=1 Tax=Phasianus colchicus TaxID=9054 RepID=UPI00129D3E19|nr:atherin-like [Phasianus colchicus]
MAGARAPRRLAPLAAPRPAEGCARGKEAPRPPEEKGGGAAAERTRVRAPPPPGSGLDRRRGLPTMDPAGLGAASVPTGPGSGRMGPRCSPPPAHARGVPRLSVPARSRRRPSVQPGSAGAARERPVAAARAGPLGAARARRVRRRRRLRTCGASRPDRRRWGRSRREGRSEARRAGGGAWGRDPLRSSGAPPLGPSFMRPADGRFVQKTVRSGREQVRSVVDKIGQVILALSLPVARRSRGAEFQPAGRDQGRVKARRWFVAERGGPAAVPAQVRGCRVLSDTGRETCEESLRECCKWCTERCAQEKAFLLPKTPWEKLDNSPSVCLHEIPGTRDIHAAWECHSSSAQQRSFFEDVPLKSHMQLLESLREEE